MNCHDVSAWLDKWLDAAAKDGTASRTPGACAARLADEAGLHDHLVECRACREQYAAAQRLMEGVKALPRVSVPAGLADRIVSKALADRANRRRRFARRF